MDLYNPLLYVVIICWWRNPFFERAGMWLVAWNMHHDELPDLSCRRGKIESRDADNFSKSLEKSF
jgi:hypothetical protein